MTKIALTRCHILKVKCTFLNSISAGAPPQTPLGNTALPASPAGFKGPTSKKEGRKGREKGSNDKGKGNWKGREEESGG